MTYQQQHRAVMRELQTKNPRQPLLACCEEADRILAARGVHKPQQAQGSGNHLTLARVLASPALDFKAASDKLAELIPSSEGWSHEERWAAVHRLRRMSQDKDLRAQLSKVQGKPVIALSLYPGRNPTEQAMAMLAEGDEAFAAKPLEERVALASEFTRTHNHV